MLSYLLVVAPQVMYASQRQLVLLGVLQILMILHQTILVSLAVEHIEQQSVLQLIRRTFHSLGLGLLIHLLVEIAAS